jgi:hypothetical protein
LIEVVDRNDAAVERGDTDQRPCSARDRDDLAFSE